ncbi:MAG: alpha/beta hydrolase-fold protein [Bacteroidia bacterium]|nr:alpha/beta hydrolase-fold protein [Bacteroidia bacterium]
MQKPRITTPGVLFFLKRLWIVLLLWTPVQAQRIQPAGGRVIVDEKGVMRWENSGEEITGFGVNYTVPFAHAYRSAKKSGINPLKAIDQDVYHFSRLGFDLYRVHVWDTEISDTLGNLLQNEHLQAFDYLLQKLDERNINYVLTPIAYWGNGWPEPDEKTPGFSAKYGKGNCLTHPEAIKAQENYLYQFMNHVNPYTGKAYKDDPRLIAVEISNEPHHGGTPEQVTAFVKKMVDAVRRSGYANPVFYNISHSVHFAEDYFKGGIQGGTFQWYPTGLGYQKELPGNFLPNVDDYNIPFDDVVKKYQGAKLVYEFDAADVGKSYIYPAMARSFRKAGIQLATHFSYDPTFLAYANTEYNTHYMSLVYAPDKALSLKICAEVFRQVPLYKDYGHYPQNTSFDKFEVSYEQNLALYNSEEKYFYTNTSSAKPQNPSKLRQIAGHGSSPVITYEGTGAYFLDKLEEGVWRLEVMPDPLIIDNPYGRNSLDKTVAVVQWNKNAIEIRLADLGNDFKVEPINSGNQHRAAVSGGKFEVSPGVYLLTQSGIKTRWSPTDIWQNIRLNEFFAPTTAVNKTYLVHKKADFIFADTPLTLEAEVISREPEPQVQIQVTSGTRWQLIDMQRKTGFTYTAQIPGELVKPGQLTYYLYVKQTNQTETFPPGKSGLPFHWDFYDRNPYTVAVIEKEHPVYLFDAERDAGDLSFSQWSRDSRLVPTDLPNESEYQIHINNLFQRDNENLNGTAIYDYTARHYLNPKIIPLREQLSGKTTLVLKARSLHEQPELIQIALTTRQGNAYGKVIKLRPEMAEYEIPLAEMTKVSVVTMPRPYPTFLPYYFSGGNDQPLNPADIEGLQISVGPGLSETQQLTPHHIGIVSVSLENQKVLPVEKKPVEIGETVEIESGILGEKRFANIYLPEGYHPDSAATYPVIYLLDGSFNEDFLHIVGLVQFFRLQMGMPPAIVVGIANVDRKRDFTFPTTDSALKTEFPTTGGSEKFIGFVEKELQPFLVAKYKVNDRRILIGQSLGGLLATEILLKNPSLFSDYLIVSPSLWWDNESLLEKAPALLSAQKDEPVQVYISVGSEGKVMERDAKALYKTLQNQNRANTTLHFKFLKKETHATILHNAIYEALEILYPGAE